MSSFENLFDAFLTLAICRSVMRLNEPRVHDHRMGYILFSFVQKALEKAISFNRNEMLHTFNPGVSFYRSPPPPPPPSSTKCFSELLCEYVDLLFVSGWFI